MYSPNFNDPRVVKRIKKAIGFASGVLSPRKSHSWSTTYIDQFFGHQSSQLGKYLRDALLIVTNKHWDMAQGKCKEYISNEQGLTYLRNQIKGIHTAPYCITSFSPWQEYNQIAEVFSEQYADELITKQFNYKDQSNRLWHPLQHVKREAKSIVLANAGLVHQYDIDCCAPTLIMQYAEQCGMDLYLFAIRGYLKDKQQFREQLADDLLISEKSAKILINALFCGAKIGHSSEFATSPLLLNDPVRINKAKVHPFIVGLKEDIKICWEYIEPFTVRKSITQPNGKQRKLPMSSKTKWAVYFDQERKVLNAMDCYLKTGDNHCFLEHDGWSCHHRLDESDVEQYIKQATNFRIKLSFALH